MCLWSVNEWSLVQIQCQQEPPVWGVVRKETLFSASNATVTQCSYEAALGSGPPSARELCTGLLHFTLLHSWLVYLSAVLCTARCLQCFRSSQGNTVYTHQHSVERGSALPNPEGSWLIQTEVPAPGPRLVHPHANEGPKYLQFD